MEEIIAEKNAPKIQLEDVHFVIEDKKILDGITLSVAAGEILCVMGLSGTGKSTLLRCIAGLIEVTSGHILIEGQDITQLSERELMPIRAQMGVVFQYAALFDSMTVAENVAFGLTRGPLRKQHRKLKESEVRARVKELLADVELSGIEDQLPAELSGGMRRRVGLARALATKPDIVLYDEPTSGLDPVTAAAIDNLIVCTRNRGNVTSIVVSHDMKSIYRVADKVLMLYQGKAQFYGSVAELQSTTDGVVRQFIEGNIEGPI
jgi:phospholipid/cholesterol/gamma-HCH transport system ATP-binding protein